MDLDLWDFRGVVALPGLPILADLLPAWFWFSFLRKRTGCGIIGDRLSGDGIVVICSRMLDLS